LRGAPKSKRPEIDADPGSYLFDFDHHTDCEDEDSAISTASPKLVVKMRVKSTPNAEPKRLLTPKSLDKSEHKANTEPDTNTKLEANTMIDNKPAPKGTTKLALRASARLGKKPATASPSDTKAYTPLTEEQIARAAPIEMRRHVSDDIDTTGWFDPVPMKNQRPVSTVEPANINIDQAFKVPTSTSKGINKSFQPGNDPIEIDSDGEVSDFNDVSVRTLSTTE